MLTSHGSLLALAERVEAFFAAGPLRRQLRALIRRLFRDHVARAAGAMTFNLFLAAIPMLALAGWLFATVLHNSPYAMSSVSAWLDLSPGEVRELVEQDFRRFSAGSVAPFAIPGSLWLASSAFHTFMSVFESAAPGERRPWWMKRLIALGCVLVAIFAFGLSGFLTVSIAGGPLRVLSWFGAEAQGARTAAVLVAMVTATLLLAAFFYIGVRRSAVKRVVWPGAIVTVTIATVASWAFARFARTLARYALFYGSLAAVAVLLLWLWLLCAALLVGAELNAQLEGNGEIPPSSDGHS
jgi:membrane protein